jgi:hypothetical protein
VHTRRFRCTAGAAAVIIGASIALFAVQTGASAGATPTFIVMNTSESLPDGVWFRNSPHTADTNRETGFGVYVNETVQDICYAWGDAVGPYSNALWYLVSDLSRPLVNGHANGGYLNAHYINDGLNSNQVVSGVDQCGATASPPPPPTPVAGFFAPFNQGERGADGLVEDLVDQNGVKPVYRDNWYPPCGTPSDRSYNSANSLLSAGQYYDRLGAWSLGRLGPVQVLRSMRAYNANAMNSLNYIVLIDPGNYSDLSACDDQLAAGATYAAWLRQNPNARLVVIAGTLTQQSASKGIQQIYFQPIRNVAVGTNLRSRVTVCNYGNLDHYKAYHAGQYWIKNPIGANSCPTLNYNGTRWHPTATWHP